MSPAKTSPTGEPWSLAVEGRAPSLEPALAALRDGGMVVAVHPSAGADVGFLMACGDGITAEAVRFMLVEARGVPSLALSADRCRLLGLRPQRSDSGQEREDQLVTIEARSGVTTGVSAADRARTMRIATADGANPGDVVVPGHVPPIRVHPHGMLHRAGIPEAAHDLAVQAGAPHGAAFCHIMDEAGRSGGYELATQLAGRFDLALVTTPEILDSVLARQRLVVPVGEEQIETDHGGFRARLFRDATTGGTHVAVVLGETGGGAPMPVIVHTQALLEDVFGRRPPADRIDGALEAIAREGRGMLLYLSPGGPELESPSGQDADSPHALLLRATRRSHVVTQLLRELGISSVRRVQPD